jgi:3-oxoacyl-[acyl-carrier protein] reductase
MDIDLTTKKALVCGSSQGIGKACAIELASLGASVTLFARNKSALEQVLAELNALANKKKCQQHQLLIADFSDPEQVKKPLILNSLIILVLIF